MADRHDWRGALERLGFPDPTPGEVALMEAASRGDRADLSGMEPPEHRAVRSGLIRSLLRGGQDLPALPPRGLEVLGGRLRGEMDLSYLGSPEAPLPRLVLQVCGGYEDEAGVQFNIEMACLRELDLSGTTLAGLMGNSARLTGNFRLERCNVAGTVRLNLATIEGQFSANNATFTNPDGDALSADRASVKGDIFLDEAKASGAIRLLGATIEGVFSAQNATFTNPGGDALNADGAVVKGDIFLRGAKALGQVRLLGATIEGQFSAENATFTNPGGDALSADGASVKGDIFLDEAKASGQVRLLGATIEGVFSAHNATFTNPGGNALSADRASVKGGIFLNKAKASGAVRLLGATIEGQFSAQNATFTNPGGDALNADGASVKGGIFLNKAKASGAVRLLGATIEGVFSAQNATFTNPGGDALNADGASVKGDIFLNEAKASGEVRLLGATIEGVFSAQNATFTNPGGDALSADTASVKGGIFLNEAKASGAVRLPGATIEGVFSAENATFTNANADALNLAGTRIRSGLFLRPIGRGTDAHREVRATCVEGTINLIGTEISVACDLRGLQVTAPEKKPAIQATEARIHATLQLDGWPAPGGATVESLIAGPLRLDGARVEGDLRLSGAWLGGAEWDVAFSGEGLEVTGDLCLGGSDAAGPATAVGLIRLDRARIGGALRLDGATLLAASGAEDGREEVLSLNLARIGARLRVRSLAPEAHGVVDLRGAGTALLDDAGGDGWGPSQHGEPYRDDSGRLTGLLLRLDGFSYDRLHEPEDAAGRSGRVDDAWWDRRRAFLKRQFVGTKPAPQDFNPQPWEQVAKVLRVQGHAQVAESFARAKRAFAVECGVDSWLRRTVNRAAGFFFGHYYGWFRAVLTTVTYMAAGTFLLLALSDQGALRKKRNDIDLARTSLARLEARPEAQPDTSKELDRPPPCWEKPWNAGPVAEAALMALDLMLPVVDLKQDARCEVDDKAPRQALWLAVLTVYTILGWLISSLAVLTLSGLARRD